MLFRHRAEFLSIFVPPTANEKLDRNCLDFHFQLVSDPSRYFLRDCDRSHLIKSFNSPSFHFTIPPPLFRYFNLPSQKHWWVSITVTSLFQSTISKTLASFPRKALDPRTPDSSGNTDFRFEATFLARGTIAFDEENSCEEPECSRKFRGRGSSQKQLSSEKSITGDEDFLDRQLL